MLHSPQSAQQTFSYAHYQLILELMGPDEEGPRHVIIHKISFENFKFAFSNARYYSIPAEVATEPAVVKLMQSGKKLHVHNAHMLVASKSRGLVLLKKTMFESIQCHLDEWFVRFVANALVATSPTGKPTNAEVFFWQMVVFSEKMGFVRLSSGLSQKLSSTHWLALREFSHLWIARGGGGLGRVPAAPSTAWIHLRWQPLTSEFIELLKTLINSVYFLC